MSRSSVAVLLEDRQLSQADLMRMTGLSKKTVSDVYHGYRVSALTTAKIARALGVRLYDIDPIAAQELDGLVVR